MVRAVLLPVIVCGLVVLTSLASTPPNLERTLAAQRELVSQNPSDAAAQNDLGNLLMLAGRDAEAEAAYRRAIDIVPQSTEVRFNLALLMQQSGRLDETRAIFEEILAIDAYHGWAYYQLGVLYDEQGDRTEAVEHYARAFAYDPALSFPANNPHIIDNRFSTEALLMAQRYGTPSATRVPRHYSDPQRIADLMLEEAEPEVGEADEEKPETERARKRKRKRRAAEELEGEEGGMPRQGGARQLERADDDRATGEDDDEEDEDEDEGEKSSRRVVGSQSAGGRPVGTTIRSRSSTGTAADGRDGASTAPRRPPGSRSDRQEAMEERFRAFRERMNAGRGGSAAGAESETETGGDSALEAPTDTRVAPRRRFRPGSASTGRLELKLLPEEPAERHAAYPAKAPAIPL